MRTRLFLIAICTFCVATLAAQSDVSSFLDDVLTELEKGNCEGAQRLYNVYKDLSRQSKPSVQNLINDCLAEKKKKSSKRNRRVNLMDNSYCQDNKNRYVAWNVVGAGYPLNFVTGVEFRGGGIVGVGLYGDIGIDVTNISVEYDNDFEHMAKVTFRYAGGLKFYPYKGLFIDCGYGTIAPASVKTHFDYGAFLGDDEEDAIRETVLTSHGILFHAGYNLVTDLSYDVGFFLGLSGGASYDIINKVFAPSVNLKIGIAWGWEE